METDDMNYYYEEIINANKIYAQIDERAATCPE